MKYWEDIKVGDTGQLGAYTVTEAEILAYARKYDPQPFHIDREAAQRSIFGGLIASGWHTCAILMRLSVDQMQQDRTAGVGSPGIDSVRWLKPVRPGDTLTARTEIIETWPSRSKPMGFIRRRADVLNQHGEVVLTTVGVGMVKRRMHGEPQPQARPGG